MLFPAKKIVGCYSPEVKKLYPPPSRADFELSSPQRLYVRVGVRWRHNQNFSDG